MILFLISLISHWLWPELENQNTNRQDPVKPSRSAEPLSKSWVRDCSGRLQRNLGDNKDWVQCSRNPNIAHRRVIGEIYYDH